MLSCIPAAWLKYQENNLVSHFWAELLQLFVRFFFETFFSRPQKTGTTDHCLKHYRTFGFPYLFPSVFQLSRPSPMSHFMIFCFRASAQTFSEQTWHFSETSLSDCLFKYILSSTLTTVLKKWFLIASWLATNFADISSRFSFWSTCEIVKVLMRFYFCHSNFHSCFCWT